MIRQTKEQPDSELVAISALAFIAEDPKRLERFLSLTGLQPETIRTGAAQPDFLNGVMQHLVSWEPWLVQFAEQTGIAPEDVIRAAEDLALRR